ncbi:DUF397 domain-containing protein [Streptomyces albidoflavus]|uniref:DUF397 domain-containing protein n=1 Tax=Streptomyces albidoflavus TaxID=1886 RepID=UPI000BAE62B6|nr:DUF397 domain-containing protein [Streptomyces albidoflavus]PAX82503.1 DUF397 domain-containing protein [Streptomyces albidoflavus]PAX87941.1 DUF397 domain-containing protein [Streptomyces albidoflavus]PBO14840.1 DUF397 domain-containing protein [Streptomyces albidoflavus]PBO25519.1 DUF397 domain-containing protein [Streptomyces albidoflavus]PBO31697.1 DUF397 domain-containing protein [Streptomyces albidoflavus]
MSIVPAQGAPRWAKSTYSAGEGQCIEWAPEHAALTGEVLVRDSKTPQAPYLTLTPESFAGLVSLAKAHG